MKTTTHSVWIVLFLILVALMPAQAKDETVRLSYPSKVESSKGKEREKLFTPWMTSESLRTFIDDKRTKGEQIVFFEYNNSTGQSRGIFVSKLKLSGPFSRWSFTSEAAMEEKLNNEIKAGLQPAFISRNISGAYSMLFVSPQDMTAVRAQLTTLGIGEPRLKK
ncbi:MAG: hypothetical protein K9N47_18385 [Prosthecobacter sp.]|uniref:hypothetical protein n=1 Tax=Prosthecobacter sp. TaxID=1965333 RepID=UPI0025FB9AA1|nr:hypothetical protein [Prosthecobacter sp.]MCF7788097.1 hypothetical protein [Prosthecobacter sp.]